MALISAYNSPGVTVTENVNPSVTSLLATPSAVAIVGTAQGYNTASERAILTGTTPYTLIQTGASTSSIIVVNNTQNGATVGVGNYLAVLLGNPDGQSNSGDEIYGVERILPPATAPILASSGTGTLTGTYQYAVTFVNASGVSGETAIGPISSQVTLANQGTILDSIPTGPPGTTGRNIYRSKVTSGVSGSFNLVATINDNTTVKLLNETVTDAAAALNANPPQGINSGDTVTITYNYTNQYYYLPTIFNTFADVVTQYGPPFDGNGNILNQLTFAIYLAFTNGAQQVIGLASTSSSTFSTAFAKLLDVEQVRMVSVVSGNTSDHAALAAHVTAAAGNGLYRIGVVGQDSSAQTITPATLRASAQALNTENMILVSPSSFNITNPVSLKPYAIGAQYMASALIGMFAARDPQIPLTRKTVAGFLSPNELRTNADAALDSGAGLLAVIYKGNLFQVRHAVSTAYTDINKREVSVVRAKYEMAYQLATILNGSIVGQVYPQNLVAQYVSIAAQTVLEGLVTSGIISGYDALSARVLASSPTTVEVRFQYTPSYPINNISIIFTINTQQGNFTLNF